MLSCVPHSGLVTHHCVLRFRCVTQRPPACRSAKTGRQSSLTREPQASETTDTSVLGDSRCGWQTWPARGHILCRGTGNAALPRLRASPFLCPGVPSWAVPVRTGRCKMLWCSLLSHQAFALTLGVRAQKGRRVWPCVTCTRLALRAEVWSHHACAAGGGPESGLRSPLCWNAPRSPGHLPWRWGSWRAGRRAAGPGWHCCAGSSPAGSPAHWPLSVLRHIEQLLELLTTEILHPDSQAPSGVKSHFLEIFLEELSKVGAAEVRAVGCWRWPTPSLGSHTGDRGSRPFLSP